MGQQNPENVVVQAREVLTLPRGHVELLEMDGIVPALLQSRSAVPLSSNGSIRVWFARRNAVTNISEDRLWRPDQALDMHFWVASRPCAEALARLVLICSFCATSTKLEHGASR